MDKMKKQIGHRVKQIRDMFNINQKEYSEKLDISQQLLSKYENGYLELPDYVKFRINKLNNINLNWLITGDGTVFIENHEKHIEDKENEISQLNEKLSESSKIIDKLNDEIEKIKKNNKTTENGYNKIIEEFKIKNQKLSEELLDFYREKSK